jgi:hypothetical protein
VLLLGDINAGFPSAAEGYEDQPLDLHEYLVRNPAATFFYRVQGDCLRHEYLRDGSNLPELSTLKRNQKSFWLARYRLGHSVRPR